MAIYWCTVTTTFGGNEPPSMVVIDHHTWLRDYYYQNWWLIWDNENPPIITACMNYDFQLVQSHGQLNMVIMTIHNNKCTSLQLPSTLSKLNFTLVDTLLHFKLFSISNCTYKLAISKARRGDKYVFDHCRT